MQFGGVKAKLCMFTACSLFQHKAFPRTFAVLLDRRSAPAGRHGGGCSAARCCSSWSASRTRCARAASASSPSHLPRVRFSDGARARKVLTLCAHGGVRRKFFKRLRWGARTRTHHRLVRRHGNYEQLRCACRQSALRARAASGCFCTSQLTDVRCRARYAGCSMVQCWASEKRTATRADRREALVELVSMGRMRVGPLVALLARSFMCVRDTRVSLCAKKCALRRCRVRVCKGPMACMRCILVSLNGIYYSNVCVKARFGLKSHL